MSHISQVILVRTDNNLCRKELTVHWSVPNSLIRSYLKPCTNSNRGDESEAVAPVIWLYQTVDARKEEVFFPDLLITLRRHAKLEEGSNIALDWFDETHMKANISKFQSIILRPKGSISDVSFCISEHIQKPIPCAKLLGVKIDDRLSFDDHISSICLCVSYQINGLRRIMKYMTIENRISIYNAFLAANFTYCNTVWHFCSNRGMYMLEKVHKKALRPPRWLFFFLTRLAGQSL